MEQEKNVQSSRAEIYDWIQSVLAALIACVLIFVFLARMVNVDGRSMYPTLNDGDKIIISNLFYTPKQGDIVVLRKEAFMNDPIVKRVIAVGGQKIEIRMLSSKLNSFSTTNTLQTSLPPSQAAVISAVPVAMPFTLPPLSTLTTPVSEDVQLTPPGSEQPVRTIKPTCFTSSGTSISTRTP